MEGASTKECIDVNTRRGLFGYKRAKECTGNIRAQKPRILSSQHIQEVSGGVLPVLALPLIAFILVEKILHATDVPADPATR